jgi:acyl-CoA thioesterase FadM
LGEPFSHSLRVRYSECDAQGVVFNSHYLVGIERLGNTGMHSRHQILRGHGPLIEGEMRHVFVDLETLAQTTTPDWARAGLAPWVLERDRAETAS